MNILIVIIQVIAGIAACLVALLSIPLFLRFRWPAAIMWGLKIYISALSVWLGLIGAMSAIAGLTTGSVFISVVGTYAVLAYLLHFISVTRPPGPAGNFEQAFGSQWENNLSPDQKKHFLTGRSLLKLPSVAHSQFVQNIPFATIPVTGRTLLCDLWQPSVNMKPSGLAFIYMHGSAFYFLDKDYNTRTLFSYLAAQGHVVMDVAYRLAPETDIMGMVHDVKRAIFWLKGNAGNYGINPNKIIVGGASSGGHLALMAAYTANDPQFTPIELQGKDGSVCAVISLYGPTDLEALYYHTNQHLTTRPIPGQPKKSVPSKMPAMMKKNLGDDYYRLGMNKDFEKIGTLAPLLGGHPDECPEAYALLSPLNHVHPGCPPTLLIHGEHDIMAPVGTTRLMFKRLLEKQVPAVLHILPQTDHAFDLILPKISPAAHNAIFDIERFMGLMATTQTSVIPVKPNPAVSVKESQAPNLV